MDINENKNDELKNGSGVDDVQNAPFLVSQSDEFRSAVQTDERTIDDEIKDFVFTTGKVKKVKKKSHHHSDEHHHSDDSYKYEDLTIVASNRSASDNYSKSESNGYSSGSHHHSHSHHNHGKKRMKLWKKILLSIISVILAVVIGAVATLGILWCIGKNDVKNEGYSISAPEGVEVQNQGQFVVYNGKTYRYNENITNILMIGVDRRELGEYNDKGSGGQGDVNILMAIDTKTGKTSIINISRDTMVEVTEYSVSGNYVGMHRQQLCLAYSYGDGKKTSCENQVATVQRIFYNLPIKSYYSLDLDGIAAINDSIGGVDVVSPETIKPFTQGETYHLEGSQAEQFVRKRDTSKLDSNNNRMKRQQVYIDSFMKKVISQTKNDLATPLNLYNASKQYSCTNINASKVCYLASVIVPNRDNAIDVLTVPGEVTKGERYAEFNIDETKFYEMFLSVFYTPVEN